MVFQGEQGLRAERRGARAAGANEVGKAGRVRTLNVLEKIMPIATGRRTIHCPECNFEGKARKRHTGGGFALLGAMSLVAGLFFWPLIGVSVILFLVVAFCPAKQICPHCEWEHPIPLVQWQENRRKGT